jgi:class 3 adenylate cyclase/tetratricopeptide (TPR) repeat protein
MSFDSKSRPLSSYLPRWARAFAASETEPAKSSPAVRTAPAAILLLDIAGFTQLTDKFALNGDRGAEQLSDLLNDCFTELLDVADNYGADVASFTGDGFLLVWDGTQAEQAALVASQCALTLRSAMSGWSRSRDIRLSQRIAVDIGTLSYCKVGGHRGAWRYLVAGDPIDEIGMAYRSASADDIILCKRAFHAISDHCRGEWSDHGLRLLELRRAVSFTPVRDAAAPDLSYEPLVPEVVRDRHRIAGGSWLGEFRTLSVVCIRLLKNGFQPGLLGSLHASVLSIQLVAENLEGSILDVLMDDKGLSAWLAFGAPPFAHADNPLRAALAGIKIYDELKMSPLQPTISVASGKLFCGDCGGRTRRNYTVSGQAINIAARLIDLSDSELVCDAATARAIAAQAEMSALPPQRIKGRPEPIVAYRPLRIHARRQAAFAGETLGREREQSELRSRIEALRGGHGGCVVLDGPAGIGKSRLLTDLAAYAESRDVRVLSGHAAAIERSTPFFAWRPVLLKLADVDPAAESRSVQENLAARLGSDTTLLSWVPLLGDILPIGFSDTPLTEQITGAARAASIEALMVALLEGPPSTSSILLLEDLHWFDDASLSLLETVVRRIPDLLVVATRRTVNGAGELANKELARATVIEVRELSFNAVAELVRRRLEAALTPQELVRFIYERAGGNPLYCEELASALREMNVLHTLGGAAEVTLMEATTQLSIPTSLEGAIIARVDALRIEEQLIVKVASAIGEPFDAGTLLDAFAGAPPVSDIEESLHQLVARDFLRTDEATTFAFRHAVTEDVIYRLLSFAQRRQLHASLATALERRHADRLEGYLGQLVRHWEGAEDIGRTVAYLERSAQRSLRSYANRDAIRYVQKAFRLQPAAPDASRFLWESILGDAHSELAEYDVAVAHYERALTFARERVAGSASQRARSLTRHLGEQFRLRLLPITPGRLTAEERGRYERVAHIRERLAERHFFRNESVAVLDETLAALNRAERCGAVAEMMSGYSALALGLGMSGLRSGANFYRRQALSLAEKSGRNSAAARAYLLAAVLGYGTGEWEFTERCADRSLSLFRELGDPARTHAPLTIQLFSAILRGEIARAEVLLADLGAATALESTGQGKAWHLAATALIGVLRGEITIEDADRVHKAAAADLVRADRLLCLGVAASAYHLLKERSQAVRAAREGLSILTETGTVWGSYVYGVAGIVEVLLDSVCGTAPASDESRAALRTAIRHARRATRTSPVCWPQALLMRGRLAQLSGRPAKARRMLQKAAACAERLQMRREHGLALLEMGRLAAPSDRSGTKFLLRASEIFETIGAFSDLQATREVLRLNS